MSSSFSFVFTSRAYFRSNNRSIFGWMIRGCKWCMGTWDIWVESDVFKIHRGGISKLMSLSKNRFIAFSSSFSSLQNDFFFFFSVVPFLSLRHSQIASLDWKQKNLWSWETRKGAETNVEENSDCCAPMIFSRVCSLFFTRKIKLITSWRELKIFNFLSCDHS